MTIIPVGPRFTEVVVRVDDEIRNARRMEYQVIGNKWIVIGVCMSGQEQALYYNDMAGPVALDVGSTELMRSMRWCGAVGALSEEIDQTRSVLG